MTGPDNSWAAMPQHRRELYFRVIDSLADFHLITLRLHFLDNHFPLEKLDRALLWLVQNRFTGRAFLSWFEGACSNSDLEMHRILIAVLDHEALAPVVAGRNFRS